MITSRRAILVCFYYGIKKILMIVSRILTKEFKKMIGILKCKCIIQNERGKFETARIERFFTGKL